MLCFISQTTNNNQLSEDDPERVHGATGSDDGRDRDSVSSIETLYTFLQHLHVKFICILNLPCRFASTALLLVEVVK